MQDGMDSSLDLLNLNYIIKKKKLAHNHMLSL